MSSLSKCSPRTSTSTATTSLVGHCLPHHCSFITKQYRKALLIKPTYPFAIPNGQLGRSDYPITENHVNAFQQIGELICVIYEFLQRKLGKFTKINLGIYMALARRALHSLMLLYSYRAQSASVG